MKKVLLVLFTLLLTSCASTIPNLQRESARNIGNNLMSKDVIISNVKRGVTSVSWSASTPSGCYECEADDMVRRTNCVKVDCNKNK